jgi:hypothetical protein
MHVRAEIPAGKAQGKTGQPMFVILPGIIGIRFDYKKGLRKQKC